MLTTFTVNSVNMAEQRIDDKKTARRILDAAAEILANEGYPALSMRRLGAAIGLSQAAIYRHYADKAELVSRLVEEGYADLAERLGGVAAAGGEVEEILAAAVRTYVEFAAERPTLFKALLLQDIGEAGKAVEAFAPGIARRRRTFELLAGLLRRGMDEGRFDQADPELTAQALWAGIFGIASRLVIEAPEPGRRSLLVERQIEILVRGLSAPRGGRDATRRRPKGAAGKEGRR